MYRMKIDVSGEERVFLFQGPGCRKRMLEWWRDHLGRAAAEDIRAICVWGTVGNKTDLVREWAATTARAPITDLAELNLRVGTRAGSRHFEVALSGSGNSFG